MYTSEGPSDSETSAKVPGGFYNRSQGLNIANDIGDLNFFLTVDLFLSHFPLDRSCRHVAWVDLWWTSPVVIRA